MYLLGRNSSRKTSVLKALSAFDSNEIPQDYPRFENYEMSGSNTKPYLIAVYESSSQTKNSLSADNLIHQVIQAFGQTGLSIRKKDDGYHVELTGQRYPKVGALFDGVHDVYADLIDRIVIGETIVEKLGNGSYAFFPQQDSRNVYQDRIAQVGRLIENQLGAPPMVRVPRGGIQISISAQWIENLLFRQFPEVFEFTNRFSVEDNLPRELTQQHLSPVGSSLTEAFVSLLGPHKLLALLEAKRNSSIRQIELELNGKLKEICVEINSDVSRDTVDADFIEIEIRKESGIRIEVRVDGGPSYYEHLSDNTKFLIAFNIIQQDRAQKNYLNSILLFDEPNRGFHPSNEGKVLNFLERLAARGNQVIIATHSQHMIDLDRVQAIRLMGKDNDQYLYVYNRISDAPNSQEATLALQPVTDAIGLRYADNMVVQDHVVITEGYTELIYLRALAQYLGCPPPSISPILGDGKIQTLASFLISQGVAFKIIVDEKKRKAKLQEHFPVSDSAIFVVQDHLGDNAKRTIGIEDLFSKKCFSELLKLASHSPNKQHLSSVSNSEYAKANALKGLLAHTLAQNLSGPTGRTSLPLDEETKTNFRAVLNFCANSSWYRG